MFSTKSYKLSLTYEILVLLSQQGHESVSVSFPLQSRPGIPPSHSLLLLDVLHSGPAYGLAQDDQGSQAPHSVGGGINMN